MVKLLQRYQKISLFTVGDGRSIVSRKLWKGGGFRLGGSPVSEMKESISETTPILQDRGDGGETSERGGRPTTSLTPSVILGVCDSIRCTLRKITN